MRYPTPLIPGTLVKRYKRFLADVTLEDGRDVTAHCANPGSMMGLADPGSRVWLEPNDDPRKKLKYGLRLVEAGGACVGVDTGAANRVVKEALEAGAIPGLPAYDSLRAEVKYGTGSRVDFLLSGEGGDTYLEVKSVTLSRRQGLAEFPDSVTARGARHLAELAEMAQEGHGAVLLYLVQRGDCDRVSVAEDIDPGYAAALTAARKAGVQVMALGAKVGPEGIEAGTLLPVE